LKAVDEELEQIKSEGVKVGNLFYIKIIHVYDLSAFWHITTITKFECPYGPDGCRKHHCNGQAPPPTNRDTSEIQTNVDDPEVEDPKPKRKSIWQREIPAEGLFCHSADDFVICILHLKMRMVDLFMELLVDRSLIEDDKLTALRKKMAQLDIPFETYYSDKEKYKGRLRVRGYTGKQAARILQHIQEIASVWPEFLAPCFDELKESELREYAVLYGVSLTREVSFGQEMTVSQLKDLLTINRVKHSLKRKADLLNLAKSKNLSTTTTFIQTFPKSRSEIEAELKQKWLAKKRESETETHTQLAIRLWTTIAEMIDALEYGKTNDPIFSQWKSLGDRVDKEWSQLHTFQAYRIYLHLLVSHGAELHKEWGPLSRYSQQGVEGANKTQVAYWDQHTPRGGGRVKKSQKPLNPAERKKRKFERMVHSYSLVLLEPYLNLNINEENAEDNDSSIRC
jgi:hypothetical protein